MSTDGDVGGHRAPERRPLPVRVLGSLRIAHAALGARDFARRSAAATLAAQERRLRRMVHHAFATVPFYAEAMRRLGLAPGDIRSAGDLALLPIVERVAIQREPERFLSRARPRDAYLALRSGGSSGEPRVVHHDPVAVLENSGHGERHLAVLRRLTGKPRLRVLTIGSPHAADALLRAFARRHAVVPDHVLAPRDARSMAERPEDVARAVAETRPDVVVGYGSFLEALARVLEENGERSFVPRVLVYGGDAMAPGARARIGSSLGATVWSTYQAVECLKIAFECEQHHGLHVHADLCALRIADRAGNDVPPGTSGDVVISNLVNRATVLLNYRLGDRAALVPGPCPCGSPLPLLGFPEGRVEDWLVVPSGERVYTQRLRALFTDEVEVWQYQIVQERTSAVRVAVVAAGGADRTALASRLGDTLAGVLGPGVAVRIEFVGELERTAAGKVLTIVRRSGVDQAAPRA